MKNENGRKKERKKARISRKYRPWAPDRLRKSDVNGNLKNQKGIVTRKKKYRKCRNREKKKRRRRRKNRSRGGRPPERKSSAQD